MCGRYYVDDEESILEMRQIIDEINRKNSGNTAQMKSGEIFPTDVAPVFAADGKDIAPRAMRWGFPKWQGFGVIINARSETAGEKSMFRKSLMERRIAVPTTGFFEWRHVGKKATEKFLFRQAGSAMLYLAGMYNCFRQPDGSEEERYVILTTAANDSVAAYHDRMPVLLGAEEFEAWIMDNGATSGILSRVPVTLEAIEAVSARQNVYKLGI